MRPTRFGLALSLMAAFGLSACGDKPDLRRGANEMPDDQIMPPAPPPRQLPVSGTQNAAMTFKAKHDAPMTSIKVYVARLQGQGSNDITLTLMRTTGGGAPDPSAVLATATFSSSQANQNFDWVHVTLPSPVPVTVGQGLAISLRATGPASLKWGATASDAYADGAAFTAASAGGPWDAAAPATDLGFRSFVATPQ